MFANVEPSPIPRPTGPAPQPPRAPTPTPSPFAPTPPPVEPPVEVKEPIIGSRRKIIVVGVIAGIVVVGAALYGALRFLRSTATAPAPTVSIPPVTTTEPEAPFAVPEGIPTPLDLETAPPAPAEPVPLIDTDSDGLTDEEETALGTDPGNPDSDADNLFDREEVKTYETDPLNPDTDGDTYLDGQEVSSGYNPKGAGRLFTVPSQ